MLTIELAGDEMFNNATGEFIYIKPITLHLEHSLSAIAEWEKKYRKPFLGYEHTRDELLYYIVCMNQDPITVNDIEYLVTKNIETAILTYVADKPTATTIDHKGQNNNNSGMFVTSELVYSWMVALRIPFECDKWNYHRLISLIECCQNNSTEGEKMTKEETAISYRELNKQRREKFKTRG